MRGATAPLLCHWQTSLTIERGCANSGLATVEQCRGDSTFHTEALFGRQCIQIPGSARSSMGKNKGRHN
ncbi:uncharacterized protein PHALS_02784 [Plasmopara halstedii]|uniref:Uncharacterized protein n=1 Tax=Plasmopara halstedii TaxID=4781 RepID=A0A0P1AYP1_PLAHL|nr:uncharacterized protein PHALS_02784 [Plasmopara halstedii]CEG46381.1 hypothetical protein PHALS_02784 [Plasmopara halstedii]|eukprot:XP_024582750.1 hypothetical protein PHALS_02784 [Plasmopara halstedii]